MNARPWYRWHWVTYVLLLVTGGAVVYSQAFHPYRSDYGWPFVFVDFIWRPGLSRTNVTWYPILALADVAVCVFIFGSVIYCSEYVMRNRFRITIGSVLMFVFAVALAFSWAGFEYDLMEQGRYNKLRFSQSLPLVVSTAWAPLPVRIIIWSAIACTFNVIGWGVMRFSIQCGRAVSRNFTGET